MYPFEYIYIYTYILLVSNNTLYGEGFCNLSATHPIAYPLHACQIPLREASIGSLGLGLGLKVFG